MKDFTAGKGFDVVIDTAGVKYWKPIWGWSEMAARWCSSAFTAISLYF
ncbi:MAG: hypothetical protein PHX89_07900 [bacterium]|nr:hypothetical protein [bacterium]